DDELGTYVDNNAVMARLELLQLLRLPLEQLVGHSFECLAEHDESTGGIAGAQMKVRQPALPPAVTPLGGEDHEVERVRLFDLDPIPRSSTRFISRVQLFYHQTFVAGLDCFVEEPLRFLLVGGDQARW